MKQKRLLRTLLVALCLLVGANVAWATDAFVQNFTAIGESTNPSDYGFTITVQGTVETGMSATVTGGKLVLVAGGNGNSRGYDAKATFDPISVQNEITFTCTWATGNCSGNNNSDGTAGSFSQLSLGDGSHTAIEIKYAGKDKYLMVNGTKVKENVNQNQTYNVSATLNMNTKKITALSIGTEYSISEAIDFNSADATSISVFTFSHRARASTWTNTSSIDDVSITYEEKLDAVESFVVNYKYNDATIASENIDVDGLKIGNSYTVPFRMYVSKDGVLYKTSKNSSDYYRDAITLSLNTVVNKNLSSVDIDGGTLVLLEDLDDTDGENASIRASYGKCYNNKSYTSSVTLSPGIYKFIIKAQNKGRGSSIKVGETTLCGIGDINADKGTWTDKEFTDVSIPTAGKVSLAKGSNNTIDCYDIIIAIRTGDYTVSKEISAAGWATYCSPYALDLANATNLTDAYIVTGGESGVLAKTSVKNSTVPANTGLLLKGDAGTATIPVVASSTTDVTSNILKGVTADTQIDAGTGWVLMGSPSLGFYQNSNAFTVGANTAYILVSVLPAPTGPARASYLLFGDDVTGISQVTNAAPKVGNAVYNFNGQRVNQPTKGLYIIDGKKVAVP